MWEGHKNFSNYTPLVLAASGGYVTIIKLLVAHGAEINSRTSSKLGISPLVGFTFKYWLLFVKRISFLN